MISGMAGSIYVCSIVGIQRTVSGLAGRAVEKQWSPMRPQLFASGLLWGADGSLATDVSLLSRSCRFEYMLESSADGQKLIRR